MPNYDGSGAAMIESVLFLAFVAALAAGLIVFWRRMRRRRSIGEILESAVREGVEAFRILSVAVDEVSPALVRMANAYCAARQGWEIMDGTVTEIGYREIADA